MKYFLGFLAAVGLIILVFILVLRGFGGDKNIAQPDPLSDYANTDALVRMTVDGPIVADQQHNAYRISVGRSETRTYENNQQGFTNFLRALDVVGFNKGNDKATKEADDERGMCATGKRFVFEIINGTSQVQRYWSSTCGTLGTFKGNSAQVKSLFDRQVPIPDFPQMTSRLRLGS